MMIKKFQYKDNEASQVLLSNDFSSKTSSASDDDD